MFSNVPRGLYGQQIVIEANANKLTKESADELARWLGQTTGKKFEIGNVSSNNPASAIFLLSTNSPLVSSAEVARLKDKGKEAFAIRSDGEKQLWIVGNTSMAIQHGVYEYLDQLGCRWFFPNDHWTIIPSLKSIAVKIDRLEAPAYRYRDFGGTGGFGGSLVMDPERKLQARWMKWEARNRLGGVMPLSGHTGEAFNTAHRKELEAHPEYLSEIGGKRQPWAQWGSRPMPPATPPA